MIPIAFLFCLTKYLLLAIGQNEIMAADAQLFCVMMIPACWAQIQFDATKRFCACQLKNKLPFQAQLFGAIVHIWWCYFLIQFCKLEIAGAALALTITHFTNLFVLERFIGSREDFKETWIKNDDRSYQEWVSYFEVGWYGALLECLGWWNLHICFLFSGYLGVTQIAAQVVIMQIKNFTSTIPSGVSFAASGLVGNCIGMNQVQRAKQYSEAAIKFSCIMMIVLLTIFTLLSKQLADIFTEDLAIEGESLASFWSLFLYIFFSSIKGVQNGVIRALALQKNNTLLTLIFAYGLGIPLAALFCFYFKMGLAGMWFGISISNALLCFAIQFLINNAPWEALANAQKKTADRKSLIQGLLNEKTPKTSKKKKVEERDDYER